MLVLSRRRGERIRIGEDVWITICSSSREKVRVGIEAPDGVPVMREELLPIPFEIAATEPRTDARGDHTK
jgi:carbon storage regulator